MPDVLPLGVTIGYNGTDLGVTAYRRDERVPGEPDPKTHARLTRFIQHLMSQPPAPSPLPDWPAELAGTPEQRLRAITAMLSQLIEITGGKGGLIHTSLSRLKTFESHALAIEYQWLDIARRDLSPVGAGAFQICLTALRILSSEQRPWAVQAVLGAGGTSLP